MAIKRLFDLCGEVKKRLFAVPAGTACIIDKRSPQIATSGHLNTQSNSLIFLMISNFYLSLLVIPKSGSCVTGNGYEREAEGRQYPFRSEKNLDLILNIVFST